MKGAALFRVLTAAALLSACERTPPEMTAGQAAIERYGCGGCHAIPGVNRGFGKLAPTLDKIATRNYIGGVAINTSENMVRWVQNPQSISPRTAMPNLRVTEEDARAIAAYLYTLR